MFLNRLKENRVANNAAWLIAGKLVHMVLSFLVGLLTARYLGPDHFGLINYAAAYTSFFSALCTLGINSIIVKNFIEHPDEEGETIGTTLLLRALSSLFSALMIVGVVSVLDRGETLTFTVVALYCIGLLFQIFDTLNYWFQARLQSKYYAVATLVAYVIVSAYKVTLLVLGMSVKWFAVANAIEYALVGAVMLWQYHRCGGPRFSCSLRKAGQLLRASRSFIVAGLMVSIYASTDRLMLKQMLSEASVAYYALAVSFSSSWGFLLSAIIDSMTPEIMRTRSTDHETYLCMNRRLYAYVFYAAAFVSLCVSLAAPWLIVFLYGESYRPAVEPLRVVVWYTAFSYLGVARNTWMVCENVQKYLQILYPVSAVMNVVLNLIMIPRWGATGAALASLLTQISTIVVVPYFIPQIRENTRMMIEAMLFRKVRIPIVNSDDINTERSSVNGQRIER